MFSEYCFFKGHKSTFVCFELCDNNSNLVLEMQKRKRKKMKNLHNIFLNSSF